MQTNVLEYLENTVKRLPDKLAFSDGDKGLTFGQVWQQSRAVGSFLAGQGISRQPVVVFMEKSPEEIAAFFGVIQGGCYYVPIDEDMPKSRIEMILKNLDSSLIICDGKNLAAAGEFEGDYQICLYEDMIGTEIDEEALRRIRLSALDTDPIYIVFTSGSTGAPKGVVACHRSVIDYIESLSEVLEFSEDTVFANQVPLYVDACLKEIYPTVKYGATTYLVPKSLFMFPVKLVRFLNEHQANTVCWVVSALTMISAFGALDKEIPQYLHTVAFGSEVFPIKQFRRWREALPNAKFVNLYGPTEATGMSCYYKVEREFELDEVIPIGGPFKNTEIILLDEDNKRPPQGEPGEICIRGTSLTLGYYKDFEKTGKAFVQNPLNPWYPELIYRTGDLGKYNERGELIFVSRKDYQIKHMGYRIELGEIEANVNLLDGIKSSCCIYSKDRDRIVLYYVGDPDVKAVIGWLKERLPRYMIPNEIKVLETMPLTPNGKINRAFLAAEYAGEK